MVPKTEVLLVAKTILLALAASIVAHPLIGAFPDYRMPIIYSASGFTAFLILLAVRKNDCILDSNGNNPLKGE